MRYCPKNKGHQNWWKAHYCAKCGTALKEDIRLCAKCHWQALDDSDKFCTSCGGDKWVSIHGSVEQVLHAASEIRQRRP
jgi:uncharacterized membrane protein YvbJ